MGPYKFVSLVSREAADELGLEHRDARGHLTDERVQVVMVVEGCASGAQ